MKETYGQLLSKFRKRLGFTQEEVAEKVGVTPQAVSKWENDISAPDISALPILADIFNVTTDELLGREVIQTALVPESQRKDIDKLLLKIFVSSSEDGVRLKINFPVSLIMICLETGLSMPSMDGKDYLKKIDYRQIFAMIEAGVIGKLVEMETDDGDTVSISVE